MLEIKNLHAKVDGELVLKGVNLSVLAGEVHAIMGPNGSGKSTLSNVIAGKPEYEITDGEIVFDGKNINDLVPDERARMGIFLGFQYPVELPGVRFRQYLKTAIDSIRKYRNLSDMSPREFTDLYDKNLELLKMDKDLVKRSVNDGFSGGEKKRSEVLQMCMLQPKLAILDETDSGLDIDALHLVANAITSVSKSGTATVLVTHYKRILTYVKPQYVHILYNGQIVESGSEKLADDLEKKGYDALVKKN